MADSMRPFSGRERAVGATTVIELSGELDILARLALIDRLDVLTSDDRPDLVLDLRRVTFMDCGGLALLCRVRLRVRARQGRLRLLTHPDSPSVARLLRLTGLLDAFDIHPDLTSALSGGDTRDTCGTCDTTDDVTA